MNVWQLAIWISFVSTEYNKVDSVLLIANHPLFLPDLLLPDLVSSQSEATKPFRSCLFPFTFTLSVSASSLHRTLNTGSHPDVFAFQITTLENWRQRVSSLNKRMALRSQLYFITSREKWKISESKNAAKAMLNVNIQCALIPLLCTLLNKFLEEVNGLGGSQIDEIRCAPSRNRSPSSAGLRIIMQS